MNHFSRTIIPVLIVSMLILAVPASAKGAADLIVFEHPGLAEPIEVDDPDTLLQFNPWAGEFLGTGGALESPPYVGLRIPYQVYTYLINDQDEYELRYMFYFYPDLKDGRGYIYLPGPDEPYYSVNAGTIIRGKSDGYWHLASPAFEARFQELNAGEASSSSRMGSAPTGGVLFTSAALGAITLGVIIYRGQRRRPD